MERMEHVKRPALSGVRLQVLGGCMPPLDGGLFITAFFLIFSTRKQTANDEITVSLAIPLSGQGSQRVLLSPPQVLHTSVSHIDYKVGASVAVLYLKDFRRFHFEFSSPEDCKDLVEALEILSRPGNKSYT